MLEIWVMLIAWPATRGSIRVRQANRKHLVRGKSLGKHGGSSVGDPQKQRQDD